MDKNLIYRLVLCLALASCGQKSDTNEVSKSNFELKEYAYPDSIDFENIIDKNFQDWVEFYQSFNHNFSLDKFKYLGINSYDVIDGNVFGKYEASFDTIYSKFLVFNNNGTKYIDFDSYQWSLGKNGDLHFSPDQEINLVNIKNETVSRIGFNGPSYWVEEAFWKNDTTVVLLGNSYEKKLFITLIYLNQKKKIQFEYQDTIDIKSAYIEFRFRKLGLEIK